MIEIGRLCMKIAGRDAGKYAVIVDILDSNYILLDGQTRRKKCNINHIEPLKKVLDIKKEATHEEVIKALAAENIEVKERKTKEQKPKPVKRRKATEERKSKKEVAKTEKKEEKADSLEEMAGLEKK